MVRKGGLLEELSIYLLDVQGLLNAAADPVADHQTGEVIGRRSARFAFRRLWWVFRWLLFRSMLRRRLSYCIDGAFKALPRIRMRFLRFCGTRFPIHAAPTLLYDRPKRHAD
jgi:hypothetical protein